jgi:hypothetical protein
MSRDSQPKFHKVLCNILSCPISGSDCRAYFQAPTSGMKYPAILYELDDIDTRHANNRKYISTRRYNVTLIDKDPDSPYVERLLSLITSQFDRHYIKDNLHHFVFTIYY